MDKRRSGLRPGVVAAVGLTSVAAMIGVAPHTAAPATAVTATAAEPAACVSAMPGDQLVADQPLTGLTVTRGTEPEPFGGTYLDTLVDGIAPGVDLVIAQLDSPAIAANGIWQGMSGSPVYDPESGRLVGAVAYALSVGPTTIAGITPAAHMLDLLGDPQAAALPDKVVVPRALRASLVASGEATRAQAAAGMRRLPVPLAVSGLSQRRFDQLDGWFGAAGRPVSRAAGSTSAAATEIPVRPGSNLAASVSHGTVTAAAVGTATAVCGDEVVGFGHPMEFAGDTTYSLHGASAVTIQPDVTLSGFKVANLGAPVGTVTQDRLAGLQGTLGPVPTTYPVSSTATYRGRTFTGTSHVSVPSWLGEVGLATMASVNDRALDHAGKGGAVASWTIKGLRRNGTPFTVTSGDRYASGADIAGAPLMDLAYQLSSLAENETERVTVTSVDTRTAFVDAAARWRLGRVYAMNGGRWGLVNARRPVVVKAGSTRILRIELLSRDHTSQFARVKVTAPRAAAGKAGRLTLTGGFNEEDDFFFGSELLMFEAMSEDSKPPTIPQLLSSFRTEQKNDELRATLRVRGAKAVTATVDTNKVVSGRTVLPVVVTR